MRQWLRQRLQAIHSRGRSGRSLLVAALALAPTFAHAEWTALQSLEKGGARITAQVRDLDTGKTVQSLHADTRLAPASVTKLVVAAAALRTWPADKTFETRVLASGRERDGQLDGDLILHGDGDATLDHKDLWLLAGQVRASGLGRVDGNLIVSPPFGPLGCGDQDRCEALERSDTAYNTPLAALGVDYGTWCVEVAPTQPGSPARVRACSGGALPVVIEGGIETAGAQSKKDWWVSRQTRDGMDVLRVGGSIALGQPQQAFRAMSDPALGAGLLLRQMLADQGVALTGAVLVRHTPPPDASRTLARAGSLALREQLGRMMRYSNNYIADLLTLNLAAVLTSPPPTQLAAASAVLATHMQRSAGADSAGVPLLYSGSGLTPENQLSAADLVAMLDAQYHDSATFPVFYGGLVVPQQAPFAFIRGGSRAWRERVALKTGTLNDPRSVCGVAGYLRKKNGGWMAFAILINGGPAQRRVPLYQSMEAIRADVEDLLARY